MVKKSLLARLPLLALFLAVNAAADWQKLSSTDFPLAPPPAAGSPELAADYATLLKLQATRTPEQCAAAAAELVPDFTTLFAGAGILNQAEMDAVKPFVESASKWMSKITGVYKKQYARPRPYDADARVQPCIDKPGGATSYPSTHATAGVLDACLLGNLFPARANALASHGKIVGDLRVIAGVHHPSDVAAGQDLGTRMCARLLKEPDFAAELEQVRKTLP